MVLSAAKLLYNALNQKVHQKAQKNNLKQANISELAIFVKATHPKT